MHRFAALVLVAFAACQQRPAPADVPRQASTASGFFLNGDVRLSYRLDIPAHTSPRVSGVVFGHGSGEVTKEACRYLADRFLQRGFATLCFDKRGVGQSTGDYSMVGARNSVDMFTKLGGDMAAGVAFLRAQPEIDAGRIGLVGGSQAGWIIPVAAAQARPAFMIMLVGPTVSVGIENFYSRIVEFTDAPVEDGYRRLPEFKGEHGFDPRPVLDTLNVPGLWLLGAEDRSIPTPATVAILDQLIAAGRPYARVVFQGAGHSLMGAPLWLEIDAWLARALP